MRAYPAWTYLAAVALIAIAACDSSSSVDDPGEDMNPNEMEPTPDGGGGGGGGDAGGGGGDAGGGGSDASVPDADPNAVCGNGNVEGGEECEAPTEGCDATSCKYTRTHFRAYEVVLKDPHTYLAAFGCTDITGIVNSTIKTKVQTDDDGDGFIDVSLANSFGPFDPSAASVNLDITVPQCEEPFDDPVCTWDASTVTVETEANNQDAGICLEPVAGTTKASYGPIVTPSAPCYGTPVIDLNLGLGSFSLPLKGARVGATYAANGELSNGLMYGFLSEADAAAVVLPADLPVVGGKPLSDLLAGGTGGCMPGGVDDRDTGPNGDKGWYFYIEFKANPAVATP